MRYVLAVSGANYGQQSAFTALQFAQALVKQGHQIQQIFFMQDGVSNANKFVSPANDEFNLLKAWQAFHQQYQVPLHLCIAAAQRRGVVDEITSATSEISVASPFILAGLGEFMQASLTCDRVLQF
ncbi:sulfurtransferase complex subunit TusD [Actinobacillus delphinicola]|uniref:Sulfur transfer complex subunit TusD n=1 Tax=Actinobacillus delphinicola TaxID=51161 RepID=A0A448TTI0_9PAST|nr:sulfurtransferase complex subunit TusD [Actinobacillus delphinicola]VEJ09312.1 sulfur transfer complex subunit TusD [Actinobacillus delphinicola]